MKKSIFKLASEEASGMAQDKVREIISDANVIMNGMSKIQVDPWVLEHITTAHDDISEIASYIRQKILQ